jgi:hypothetical protein
MCLCSRRQHSTPVRSPSLCCFPVRVGSLTICIGFCRWISIESHGLDDAPFHHDPSRLPALTDQHRRLATLSPLALFRAVSNHGLRGFLEGGQFASSSADACAQRCLDDPFCLSFDIETSTQTCYVSYTDRYAHPEAFLEFPTGVYYEWQGVVDAPTLEPNGGRFSTQPAVRLLTAKLGATIHYQVVNPSIMSPPTADELVGSDKKYVIAKSGDVVILPPYSCRVYAIAVKDGMQSSPLVVSEDYRIYGKSSPSLSIPYAAPSSLSP